MVWCGAGRRFSFVVVQRAEVELGRHVVHHLQRLQSGAWLDKREGAAGRRLGNVAPPAAHHAHHAPHHEELESVST